MSELAHFIKISANYENVQSHITPYMVSASSSDFSSSIQVAISIRHGFVRIAVMVWASNFWATW